jgi:hypothetical protein
MFKRKNGIVRETSPLEHSSREYFDSGNSQECETRLKKISAFLYSRKQF